MPETNVALPQQETQPAQQTLSPAEKINLVYELNTFSTPTPPGLSRAGEFIRHQGPRKAKRPEEVTQVGSDIQRIYIPEHKAYIQVTSIAIDKQSTAEGEAYTAEDPFTQLVLQNEQLPQEDLAALENYIHHGGKIVMVRSERPTKEFRQALTEHAQKYNGGMAFLTQANVLIYGLSDKFSQDTPELTGTAAQDPQKAAELQSLSELVRMANNGKGIHYAALTPDVSGQIPQDVQNALDKINAAIDPYEFVYWTLSSLSESQRRNQMEALGLLGVGLVLPEALKHVGNVAGPAGEMMAGSLTGDIFSLMTNAKGVERLKMRAANIKQFVTRIVENLKNDPYKGHRIVALCAILGIPTAAIALTVLTGGAILPFLLASPLVSSTILGTEIHKRMSMNPKSPEEVQEILETYMRKLPAPLQKLRGALIKRFPKTALALYDISKNPTAVGGWAGTVASAPTLYFLSAVLPAPVQMSFQLMVAASTVIFEGGAGAAAGGRTVLRDPWRQFERQLPRVQQLIDIGKQTPTNSEGVGE